MKRTKKRPASKSGRKAANAVDRTGERTGGQRQPAGGPEWAFGQALREIRVWRGMSQEALAFEAALDRTAIGLLERGLRSPKLVTVVRLATALEVKSSELVGRMEVLLAKPAPKATTQEGDGESRRHR